MTALIIRGDALHLPLRDNSVDLCITSPPYFALRAYGTGHEMEVGSEPTPHAYLEALWAATREMARVLKPSGSIWVNLGDKYNSAASGQKGTLSRGQVNIVGKWHEDAQGRRYPALDSFREKTLIGLPWRYAIGCIDQLSLILRAELIWNKPNGLPESVTDRVRRSHETWFHFVRSPRYYAALDEIREPHVAPRSGRNMATHKTRQKFEAAPIRDGEVKRWNPAENDYNPLGKLPGSVWSIPSEPLRLPPWIDTDHYAAFPVEFPRRFILAFSPPGLCVQCGQGRFPVVERQYVSDHIARRTRGRMDATDDGSGRKAASSLGITENGDRGEYHSTILGYACGCCPHTDHPERRRPTLTPREDLRNVGRADLYPNPLPVREWHLDRWTPPPTTPAIVLDPFGGTGTVAHVAHALGRIGVGVDLSEAYCRLATDQTLQRQRAGKVHGRTNRERQGVLAL